MRIYISGLYSGPNPSPGIGIARSLRLAYPDAELVGVDYSNRSSGVHWPNFDEIWLQRPWQELDLRQYQDHIEAVLHSDALWISGLDLETFWLARVLPGHPNLLLPGIKALQSIAKPRIDAHEGLSLNLPPFISTEHPDWELHAFCRKHGWRVWVKGPFYEARRVWSWYDVNVARADLARTWSTDQLFLQAHVAGHEESIALSAYDGELLGCAYMRKRDLTPEGKTWAGQVNDVPAELMDALRESLRALNWTGGAELELIRDGAGTLYLLEWNPRFPAWIHGATLAGRNLPGLLVQRATGYSVKQASVMSPEFVRVVLEIPVRPEFPLPPLPEPSSSSFGLVLKHPSGMPTLLKRLHQERGRPSVPERSQRRSPAIPRSILNDLDAHDLCRVDTPCWLFLESTAETSFRRTAVLARQASSPRIRTLIAYSIKTNPEEKLLKLAQRSGLLAEAISQLEVERVLAAGFSSDCIVLNGPGKWWPSLNNSTPPFRAIFFDSMEEVQHALSGELDNLASVIGVRLRPPQAASRFGIPIDSPRAFRELASAVSALPREHSFGIHLHLASSSVGIDQWWAIYDSLLLWAKTLESASGRTVEMLDLGGGWFPDDWHSDLLPRLEDITTNAAGALPHLRELMLEPGKALAQSSMALATRVLEVRRSQRDVEEVIVDSSIADIPEVFNYPHRMLFRHSNGQRWQPLTRGRSRVLGRLCMEYDVLATHVELPQSIQPGDLVVVCDVGAYDRSTSYVFGRG